MKGLARGVTIAALLGAAATIAAWRIGIWYLERIPPPDIASVPSCQSVRRAPFARAIDRARSHAQALMTEHQIPGLAVAVAADGKIVWSEGFGYADRENHRQACANTQFRLGSVSKPVTAAAMARLYQAGRLDLDAPIQRYVPSFPDKGYSITARHLASHRAGIRHYRDDSESLNETAYPNAVASLEKFRGDSLLFPPDTDFFYSSYGFVLLSAALEGASGRDFPTLLQELVFVPLGMRGSRAEVAGETHPDQAVFYDYVTPYSPDGTVRRSPFIDNSMKWAGGGLISTVEDLVRFGSAHIAPYNEGFLDDEALRLLLTPRNSRIRMFGYALGWMAARDPRLRRVYFHFGAGSGATSFLAIFPNERVSVAVLANLGHARFPMARLFHIVNPFVGDGLMPVALTAVLALVGAAAWLYFKATPAGSPRHHSSSSPGSSSRRSPAPS